MHLQIFFSSKQPKNKSTACSCIKRRPEPSALSVSLVVTSSPWGTHSPPPFLPFESLQPPSLHWVATVPHFRAASAVIVLEILVLLGQKPQKGTHDVVVAAAASLVVFSFLFQSQGPKPPFQTTKGNKLYRSPYSTKPRLFFFNTRTRFQIDLIDRKFQIFLMHKSSSSSSQKVCACARVRACVFFVRLLRAKEAHCVRTCHRSPPLLKIFHVMYPLSNTSRRSRASRQRQIASRNSSLCYLATPATLHPSLAAGLWKSQVAEPASLPACLPACQPASQRANRLSAYDT
ncbi:hypothetical protein E2320_016230 [Naja naja]|nr:hypothetical protein E2320_016230 [Naja naja]